MWADWFQPSNTSSSIKTKNCTRQTLPPKGKVMWHIYANNSSKMLPWFSSFSEGTISVYYDDNYYLLNCLSLQLELCACEWFLRRTQTMTISLTARMKLFISNLWRKYSFEVKLLIKILGNLRFSTHDLKIGQ